MAMSLWVAKGQGEDGLSLQASWRCSGACWRREKEMGWLGMMQRLPRVRRRLSTRAAATGHARAIEHVQELSGGVVMLCAEAEVEGRTEATGLARALARPCVVRVHALASLGVLGAYGAGQCEPLPCQWLAWSRSGKRGEAARHA
jgi:hypothetical protein